jgi:hypothetical protein
VVKNILEYDEISETINPTCLLDVNNNLNPYKLFDEKIGAYISLFLKNNDFIDTMDGNHNFATVLEDAQRIASLINLINLKTVLEPVTLYITNSCKNIEIDDGIHRFYAYLYTNTRMHVILDVDMD